VLADELRCGVRNAIRAESPRDAIEPYERVHVGHRQGPQHHRIQQMKEREVQADAD
jgi:hypothetical protein